MWYTRRNIFYKARSWLVNASCFYSKKVSNMNTCWKTSGKVKSSLYSPNRPPGLQKTEAHKIFKHSTHEGGKVVSPRHRPPLPPPPLPPGKILLQINSIPGLQCDRKDLVNEKCQIPHLKSNPRPFGLSRSASTNCTTTAHPRNLLAVITILIVLWSKDSQI